MMRHRPSKEIISHRSLFVALMLKDLDRVCEYLQEPPKKKKGCPKVCNKIASFRCLACIIFYEMIR